MNAMFEGEYSGAVKKSFVVVLILLAVFLAAHTLGALKGLSYIGADVPPMNTITVEGDGEVMAIPDIASFTFSIVEKAKTVAIAQEAATKKMQAVQDYLKEQDIDEKDIKTTSYSVYPQYEWSAAACPAMVGAYCPPGKQVLTGYEVRQSVEVKVRKTDQAGDLLSGVGEKGASELSGLTFEVDEDDTLRNQAREEAIDEAKEKAEALADQLGVRLVRIVSFSENPYGYPDPYYGYGKGGVAMEARAMDTAAPAVPTPSGENKYTSNVMITYEIR